MPKSSCVTLGNEATLLARFSHPNVVQLFDCFQTAHAICLVLEHLAGGGLLDSLQAEGPFVESHARPIFADICRGVRYIHAQGIAHRDIKCENVLLTTADRGAAMR